MYIHAIDRWQHAHDFHLDSAEGEQRTRWVVWLTAAMMLIEIAAGLGFGSMALLADGWHMATHVAALSIAVFAYQYAKRHAANPHYSFGTGKVGILGAFASAIALAVVALMMGLESITRLLMPTEIHFNEAILVAVIGLVVNLASAWLLHGAEGHEHHDHGAYFGGQGHHGHADHDHGHVHPEAHDHHRDHDHDHDHDHEHDDDHHHEAHDQPHPMHDQNLRAAYLHVVADAMTSVLAIGALLTGKYFGWIWMDACMGLVGAALIARWSWGLIQDTSGILLDGGPDSRTLNRVRAAIEADADNQIADLHIWRVGPRDFAAIISVEIGRAHV
jgi:cation diffusion facilitator family transporter